MMNAPLQSKLSVIRDHMASGRDRDALKLAASFARLGDEKEAITRGWEAMARPDFYRAIGRDPETLVRAGLDAIRLKYSIPA